MKSSTTRPAPLRLLALSLALMAIIGLASSHASAAETDRPPNVILIFMDDMGYADIGSFGAKGYETPHLDRLAAEGRRFDNFYVTQAVCSASRAGLLTGCYNIRVGIQGALGPQTNHGLHENETTLAEVCKQKDYATACFGKWHLGHHRQFLPQQHGFDEYFGLPYSNDMWPYHPGVRHLPMEKRLERWPHLPLIEGNEIINARVTPEDQEQLTTQYTEHAVRFIEKNKDRPFFLYVPHSMVHVPLYVSEKFKGKSGRGLFGDVMMEVDWSVGQIAGAVREHGLEKNTLIIFTSDNGPWLSYGDHAGSSGPLREGKGTMFEGGCRESTIMWWPGRVPEGTTCHEPAMTIDILPTVAHLIGAALPDHKIDGRNIWPLMAGAPGAKSPHEALFFYWGNELQAVRMGRWKLHFPHDYRTLDGRSGGTNGIPVNYEQAKIGLALFDLEKDLGETENVKDAHPEVVGRIEALADAMRRELGDSARNMPGSGRRSAGRL